jgi:hypothetical protein
VRAYDPPVPQGTHRNRLGRPVLHLPQDVHGARY